MYGKTRKMLNDVERKRKENGGRANFFDNGKQNTQGQPRKEAPILI
jgi:hypothetical protein